MILSNSRRFFPLFLIVGFVLVGLVFVNQANAAAGVAATGTITAVPPAAAARAAGTITFVPAVNLLQNENFIISDGGGDNYGYVVFSFCFDCENYSGDFGIDVNQSTTSEEIAAAAVTVINDVKNHGYSNWMIEVTDNLDGTISLVNTASPNVGAAGNVAITETVADSSFIINGMSGGGDGILSGETVTLLDEVVDGEAATTTYVFDAGGDCEFGPGNYCVYISDDTTASDIAVNLSDTINTFSGVLIATSTGDGIIHLESSVVGIVGNVPITDTVADENFTHTGMSGGVDAPTIGVTITESGGSTDVTEGGATDSYDIVLNSLPTNDVDITITPDAQVDVSPMTLTFTSANWDTPQTVTVTAVNDSVVEGDHTGTITHTASSTDANYDEISISDVTANITDNDYQPGFSEIPNINTPVFNGYVNSIVRSTSTIYVGGSFTSVGGETRNYIAALNANDGTLTDWDPNADNAVNALALSSDGSTLYAGGSFTTIGGQSRTRLAALNTSTGTATDWDPNVNNPVSGPLILSPDGSTLYAGGQFTTIDGQSRNKLAALNTSTGTATSWDCDLSGPHAGGFNSMALNSDGLVLYAGGYFTSIGGQTRHYIAALNTGDVCTATDWDPNASNTVTSLTLTSDESTIYAGGGFTTVGGEARNNIAALNTVIGSSTEWNPSFDGWVSTLILSPDESTIYAGGGFTTVGGEARNNIAALNTVTGSSTEWNPNADNNVTAFAINSDGSTLYAGGQFTTIGGESYPYFAEFDFNPGITITESGGSTDVTEGGVTDSYTVVLNTQPINDVEVTIATDTQVDASPTTLTFTDANYDNPQTVTVTAVNDSIVEGDHTGTITHTDSSSDPNYNGTFIADVTVNITDNDRAASGGRRDPVVTYYSYGAGHESGTATSTATSTPPTSTSTPTTASLGALQQQIADLIAQLNALILQAKARGLSVPNAAQSLIQGVFTRDLDIGMTGEDVRQLQIYLNTHGFILAPSGPGSLGSETTRFGALTQVALIKFQQASNISPAAGYFGPLTRAYILSHP